MKTNKKLTLVLVFIFLSIFLSAEELDKKLNWGFIFNTSNIFLDLESYQAGLGAKVLLDNDIALRFLADGFYSSSTDTFSITLGTAFEKHFRRKRVSPYWGGFVDFGIMRQYNETDSDNWTKNISVPISGGAILGVEFFIVETVSLFAEYNVVFEGSIMTSTTSVAGVEMKTDPEFSYTIDTGVGNEAKLGIVIYLDDVVAIERK